MMELRHCSHLHFISAIRGGEQMKLLNVTRGKPVLKFKCIQDIYDCEDSEQHYSLTKALPKVDRSMAVLRSNTVKVEPMEGQDMVEDEHTRYSKSIIVDDKRDSGLDDWDFGRMTLKQLKDTCKSKKRKFSRPADKMKRCVTTCAVPKQECIDLQADENDLDLEETLINWKLKGSKKLKSEMKHKLGSLSSKSEQLPGGQGCKQLIFREGKGPISIKVEEQFDFSHRLDITPLCYNSSLGSQQRCSGAGERSEVLETSEFGSAEQEHATVSVASQVFGCSRVFIGHLEQAGCSSAIHLLDGSSSPTSQQMAFSVPKTIKIMESTDGFSAERDSTMLSEESEVCILNQVPCEHLQHADDSSPLSRSLKPKEMELDDQYIVGDQFLLLCSPASTEEDEVSGIRSFEESQEMNFMVCGGTGYRHGSPVYADDEIPLQIQGPGMTVAYSESVDLGEYCESYSFVEDNKCPDSIAQNVGTTVSDGVCSLNEVSYQHVPHAEDAYPLSGGLKSKVMIELDDKSIKSDQLLLLPSPVLTDDEIAGRRESEESHETSYSRSARSEYCHGSPYHSDAGEIPLQIQGSCMIIARSESMNLGEPWKAYSFDDNKCPYSIAQALDRRVSDSASYIEQCLNPIQEVASPNREISMAQVVEKDLHDCEATKGRKVHIVSRDCEATLVTHDCETLIDEKRESSVHHTDAVPGICFPDNHPSDATNMVTKLETDSYDQLQPQNSPERLFSARKTISPTSQKKLCTAMRTTEFDDDKIITKCKEKESFEKEGKISDSISVDQVNIIPKRSIELSSSSKQIAMKRSGDKKYFRSKGNSKIPSCSSDVQRFSSGCRSIQTCSQSAISFSQQQMHDIERLAVSLTTELQSMKHTVAEVLHSEARTSPTVRYNANKAMESATKVEETAKRWLSIMARDCNRFCKIMKMSQTEAASPEKNIHQGTEKVASLPSKTQKERKKIIFADEAGGSLCDIKLFKE